MAPAPPDRDALVGRDLGRYRLESVAADGPEGWRYLARQRDLNRPVLVEVLPPARAHDPAARARFVAAARRAAGRDHPHLLTVYDAGEDQGLPYLVTERPATRTLRALLGPQGRAAAPAALRAGAELAAALQVLHRSGQGHGGLHLDGVGLDDRDRVLLDLPPRLPAPARPELDLLALGRVLFQLLTGVEAGPSAAPPSAHNPDLRAEVDDLVLGCLEGSGGPDLADLAGALSRAARRATLAPPRRHTGTVTDTFLPPPPTTASPAPRSQGASAAVTLVVGSLTMLLLGMTTRRLLRSPPRLLELQVEAGARLARLRWRLSRAAHVELEWGREGEAPRRMRPATLALTEGQATLEDLAPRTTYQLAVLLRDHPSASPVRAGLRELRTEAGPILGPVRVQARSAGALTLTWSSSAEVDTLLRVEHPDGRVWTLESPEQPRTLRHRREVQLLDPGTAYRLTPLASDPERPGAWLEGPPAQVRTRPAGPGPSPRDTLRHLFGSYLRKLEALTPDERDKLQASVAALLPGAEDLDQARKRQLLATRTDPTTFPERRRWLRLWVTQLRALGVALPVVEGRPLDEQAAYLGRLFDTGLNEDRALAALDAALAAAGKAEGLAPRAGDR